MTLTFREAPNPSFSQVAVADAAGVPVRTGPPRFAGTAVTVELIGSTAGVHTVAYRITSVDGHPVQGSFTFTVATGRPTSPASAPAVASPTPSPGAAAAPGSGPAGEDRAAVTWWWAVPVLAIGVVAAAWWRRRRAVGEPR